MSLMEQNTYFIQTNGDEDIRDFTVVLLNEIINLSKTNGVSWKGIVLIITLCCVFTIVLTSGITIPIIFNLENEEMEVIGSWV